MSSKIRNIYKILPQFFTVLGAVSVAVAMLLSLVNVPVQATVSHVCPETGLYVKTEFDKTVSIQVKEYNTYGWVLIADDADSATWGAYEPYAVLGACMKSGTTLTYFGPGSTGGDKPGENDISHVVVYFKLETATATNTPTSTPFKDDPTSTPTNTPTNTPVPDDPTSTPTSTPTNTPVPDDPTSTPTSTPTNTPIPDDPTSTPTNTPTNTSIPDDPTSTPTNTPTNTPIPDDPTPTPEDPGQTPTPDLVVTPVLTVVSTSPPPTSNDPPTILIPVTGSELDGNSPLDRLHSVLFNLGLSFLGLGLVLQSLRKKINL